MCAVEKWVSTKVVAEHLGRPVHWVQKYAPVMPHVRVGREFRFKISEVEEWLEDYRGGGQRHPGIEEVLRKLRREERDEAHLQDLRSGR